MAQRNGKRKAKQYRLAEPILDEETRRRREVLAEMETMSDEELFQLAVRAGIFTPNGELTPPYRDDAEPSACRPSD